MSGQIKPQTPVVESQVVPQQPFARWLFNHSAIYAIIRTLLVTPEPVNVPTRHLQSGGIDLYYDQPDIGINIKYSSLSVEQGWPLTRPAITGARDALKDQDIQFLVVLIPTKEEVYQHYLEAELGKAWFEDASNGRHLMLDLCQEEGLTCLDVTDDLVQAASRGEQVYWPTDFHLNARGNQIVADAIWRFIDEHQLLAQN
jgi:hypothetical protein